MIIGLFCFIYYILMKFIKWTLKVFNDGSIYKELIGVILFVPIGLMYIGLLVPIGLVGAILQVLLGTKVDLDDNRWMKKLIDEDEDDYESDEDEEEDEEEESVFDEEIDEEESN